MKRRQALQLISTSAVSLSLPGCKDKPGEAYVAGRTVVTRKGASQMNAEEIERFTEAWALIVANGELELLAVGHTDLPGQRHHGVQINGNYTATINPDNYAHRFLLWHRAYVLDIEQAMRKALAADYQARGLDPAVADLVFMPYLDGTGYPDWLREWMPTGTPTGVFVPHIDETIDPNNGHESNGLAIGERYESVMRAFEGQCPTCPTVPPSARVIGEALAVPQYALMSQLLETVPGNVSEGPDPDRAMIVRAAAEDIVDKEGVNAMSYGSFLTIADIIENGGWLTTEIGDRFAVVPALTALDRGRAYDEYGIQNWTDEQYESTLAAVNAHIQRSPHAILHFFSAGESREPDQVGLYGSSAYFQDAGADPHFYMLHAELDRYFDAWLANNDDKPPLEGEDRLFKTWEGATEWTVDELMDQDFVPFAYDEQWSPGG